MKKESLWIIGLVLILMITGCQSGQLDKKTTQTETSKTIQPTATEISILSSPLNSPISPPPQPKAPTPTFPNPATGKAAIRGALISNVTQKPLGKTMLYLTPGVGEQGDQPPPLLVGPQEKDIRGYTDEQGWFALDNVPPGTYYMIIWAPLSWVVLSDVDEATNIEQPVQLHLKPDQTLDLGEMVIRWP